MWEGKRFYSNGDSKSVELATPYEVFDWVRYNLSRRPGNALVVAGCYIEGTGYQAAAEHAAEYVTRLTEERALRSCQCEHEAHFARVFTPNGNPGHRYGSGFAETYLETVETEYGRFEVCRDCAHDCHGKR